jgi:hypothetical protein
MASVFSYDEETFIKIKRFDLLLVTGNVGEVEAHAFVGILNKIGELFGHGFLCWFLKPVPQPLYIVLPW